MAGKVIKSRFVLLSKFSANGLESASKTATSHIRKTLQAIKTDILGKTEPVYGKENKEYRNRSVRNCA